MGGSVELYVGSPPRRQADGLLGPALSDSPFSGGCGVQRLWPIAHQADDWREFGSNGVERSGWAGVDCCELSFIH